MQSRLAGTATATATARSSTFFLSSQSVRRVLASATHKRTADPSVHALRYNPPLVPSLGQNRSHATGIEDVSCVGSDGTPWQKEDKEEINRRERRVTDDDVINVRQQREQRNVYYSLTKDVIGWKPEKLETADDTLVRERKIFTDATMRGDPDHPHSRILRDLRGEDWDRPHSSHQFISSLC